MNAIRTRDMDERTWQASPGNYETIARQLGRRGFPELALEWWEKAADARRRETRTELRTLGKRRQAGSSSLPA